MIKCYNIYYPNAPRDISGKMATHCMCFADDGSGRIRVYPFEWIDGHWKNARIGVGFPCIQPTSSPWHGSFWSMDRESAVSLWSSMKESGWNYPGSVYEFSESAFDSLMMAMGVGKA